MTTFAITPNDRLRDAGKLAGRSWRRLARVAWLQHRWTGAGVLLFFAAVAGAIIIGAEGVHGRYAEFIASGCLNPHPVTISTCAATANWVADNSVGFTALELALRFVPMVVGMFIGAPMVAREIESRTYQFAWSQGVGRTRYIASKTILIGVVVVPPVALLALLFSGWYAHEMSVMNPGIAVEWQSGYFATTWCMIAATTALGYSIGVVAGAAIKRVIPAMAATAVIYGAFVALLAKAQPTIVTLDALVSRRFSIKGLNIGNFDSVYDGNRALFVLRGWLTGPGGTLLQPGPANSVQEQALGSSNATQWLDRHHYIFWANYQTPGRYWAYQGLEGIAVLAVALLFGLVAIRLLRGRRPRWR